MAVACTSLTLIHSDYNYTYNFDKLYVEQECPADWERID